MIGLGVEDMIPTQKQKVKMMLKNMIGQTIELSDSCDRSKMTSCIFEVVDLLSDMENPK